jgi:hypothetical protein
VVWKVEGLAAKVKAAGWAEESVDLAGLVAAPEQTSTTHPLGCHVFGNLD